MMMMMMMMKMQTARGIAVKLRERFVRSFSNSCVYDCRNFAKQYKDHVMNTDAPPLLVNYGDGFMQMLTHSALLSGDKSLASVQFPSKFIVCGPCHGLFCLYTVKGEVALWNPATGDIKNLPCPCFGEGEVKVEKVGFGFDSSVNDYKILRYIARRRCFGNNNDNFEGEEKITHEMQICSLKSKQWREIAVEGEIISHLACGKLSPGSYADGACYWEIPFRVGRARESKLIYFVFDKEEFHMESLSGAVPYKTISCLIDTFNGFPAAIVYCPRTAQDYMNLECYLRNEDFYDSYGEDFMTSTNHCPYNYEDGPHQYFYLWVLMRDNGVLTWVYEMDMGPFPFDPSGYTPFCVWRNKGLIMLDLKYHLFLYDFDTKNVIRTSHSLLGQTQWRLRNREKFISVFQFLKFPEILLSNPWE